LYKLKTSNKKKKRSVLTDLLNDTIFFKDDLSHPTIISSTSSINGATDK
jgi:hypothetical protein